MRESETVDVKREDASLRKNTSLVGEGRKKMAMECGWERAGRRGASRSASKLI